MAVAPNAAAAPARIARPRFCVLHFASKDFTSASLGAEGEPFAAASRALMPDHITTPVKAGIVRGRIAAAPYRYLF